MGVSLIENLDLENENISVYDQDYFGPSRGRNSGIAMLQRALMTAGVEGMMGSPDFLRPGRGTIDHGMAIASGESEFPEAIANMIPMLGGPNQIKKAATLAKTLQTIKKEYSGDVKFLKDDEGTKVQQVSKIGQA